MKYSTGIAKNSNRELSSIAASKPNAYMSSACFLTLPEGASGMDIVKGWGWASKSFPCKLFWA